MRIKILAVVSAGILLASCSKEEEGGSMRLKFEVDPAVAEQVTRSFTIGDAPAADDFSLYIRKSDGSYERTWEKLTDYEGGEYRLKVGFYHATANYGDAAVEGFGKPAFRAEADFTILEETTSTVNMTAKLVNMAATIEYGEKFKGYFPQHYSVITTDAGTGIDFSQNEDGVAFMDAKPFKVTVHYTRQNGTTTGTAEFNVSANIAPCKHFRIIVDIDTAGASAITVSFDDTVQSEPVEIDLGID